MIDSLKYDSNRDVRNVNNIKINIFFNIIC